MAKTGQIAYFRYFKNLESMERVTLHFFCSISFQEKMDLYWSNISLSQNSIKKHIAFLTTIHQVKLA